MYMMPVMCIYKTGLIKDNTIWFDYNKLQHKNASGNVKIQCFWLL